MSCRMCLVMRLMLEYGEQEAPAKHNSRKKLRIQNFGDISKDRKVACNVGHLQTRKVTVGL